MHGRSRMTVDPRIPTMPLGRSMSGFHRPGRRRLHQARSAVRCSASRMKGELHPAKNRLRGGFSCMWTMASNESVCFPAAGRAGATYQLRATAPNHISLEWRSFLPFFTTIFRHIPAPVKANGAIVQPTFIVFLSTKSAFGGEVLNLTTNIRSISIKY